MRAADRAEQDRIDRTLHLLDRHLTTTGIPTGTHQQLFDAAANTLLLRPPNSLVGWILLFHGNSEAHHVGRAQALWNLLTGNHGRLAYVLDLDHYWTAAAGDHHLLGEAAERQAAADRRRQLTSAPTEPTRWT